MKGLKYIAALMVAVSVSACSQGDSPVVESGSSEAVDTPVSPISASSESGTEAPEEPTDTTELSTTASVTEAATTTTVTETTSVTTTVRITEAATAETTAVTTATPAVTTTEQVTTPATTMAETTTVTTTTVATTTVPTTTEQTESISEKAERLELEVVALVNEIRAENGLSELKVSDAIMSAADIRAEELVTLFDHTRPDGSTCFTALDEAGASYGAAAENIAYGYYRMLGTAEDVVDGWMNSPGHRANILNGNLGSIGVGCYIDGNYYYWVQLFTD